MTRNSESAPAPVSPRVLIFHINETVLDLQPLKRRVDRLLDDDEGVTQWFSNVLHRTLVMTAGDETPDPVEIGSAALQAVARGVNVEVSDDVAREVMGVMRALPAHPDVVPALDRLRDAGYRLAALSNSPSEVLEAQLANAGLADRFEGRFSAESTCDFKPQRRVYQRACSELRVPPLECMLVAAHGWDIDAARRAGLQTALVERPGQHRFALDEQPDLTVADFAGLADRMCSERRLEGRGGDTVPSELTG